MTPNIIAILCDDLASEQPGILKRMMTEYERARRDVARPVHVNRRANT